MELFVESPRNGASVVRLVGSLDAGAIGSVDVRFHGATSAQNRNALVDISELTFIASLGIGMLFGCAKSLQSKGHRMVLIGPQDEVDNVLRKVGVHQIIPVVSTLDEGLAAIRS